MKLQSYPQYKHSGINWLGDIPKHWEKIRLGYEARMIVPMRDKPPAFDGNIPWIRIEDFDGKYISESKSEQNVSKETINSMNYKVYPTGTVLCSCSCRMGATAIVKKPLVSNQTFIGIVPRKTLSSNYLYYAMQAHAEELQSLSTGAIQQYLSREDFQQIRLFVPSYDEQEQIGIFLDQESERIDALIEKKERQIELLQEKRSALISHAVTKGLDLNVKMKDSGIEWLGDMPEKWEIIPLKFILLPKGDAIKTGPFGSQLLSSEMMDGTVKVYNQRSVLDNDFSAGENYIKKEKYSELKAFTIHPGDILITTRGTISKCALFPANAELGILHPCLMRVQPESTKIKPEYLSLLIQDSGFVFLQLALMSNATTIEVIYSESLKQVRLPVPSTKEQEKILAFLGRQTETIDSLINKVKESIEKLLEYRTAIISAAVTGKIDVTTEIGS